MSTSDTDDTFESVGIDFWQRHPVIKGCQKQVYADVSIVRGDPIGGYDILDKRADARYEAKTEQQALRILRCIRPDHFWQKEKPRARPIHY